MLGPVQDVSGSVDDGPLRAAVAAGAVTFVHRAASSAPVVDLPGPADDAACMDTADAPGSADACAPGPLPTGRPVSRGGPGAPRLSLAELDNGEGRGAACMGVAEARGGGADRSLDGVGCLEVPSSPSG